MIYPFVLLFAMVNMALGMGVDSRALIIKKDTKTNDRYLHYPVPEAIQFIFEWAGFPYEVAVIGQRNTYNDDRRYIQREDPAQSIGDQYGEPTCCFVPWYSSIDFNFATDLENSDGHARYSVIVITSTLFGQQEGFGALRQIMRPDEFQAIFDYINKYGNDKIKLIWMSPDSLDYFDGATAAGRLSGAEAGAVVSTPQLHNFSTIINEWVGYNFAETGVQTNQPVFPGPADTPILVSGGKTVLGYHKTTGGPMAMALHIEAGFWKRAAIYAVLYMADWAMGPYWPGARRTHNFNQVVNWQKFPEIRSELCTQLSFFCTGGGGRFTTNMNAFAADTSFPVAPGGCTCPGGENKGTCVCAIGAYGDYYIDDNLYSREARIDCGIGATTEYNADGSFKGFYIFSREKECLVPVTGLDYLPLATGTLPEPSQSYWHGPDFTRWYYISPQSSLKIFARAGDSCSGAICSGEPRSCEVSEWSEWECNEQCVGIRNRTVTQEPEGPLQCPELEETSEEVCEAGQGLCPADCVLSEWSVWSACDSTCTSSRTRRIVSEPTEGGEECPEQDDDVPAQRRRRRRQNDDAAEDDTEVDPATLIKDGNYEQIRECDAGEGLCPRDCVVDTEYGEWGDCTETCRRSRVKEILEEPLNGGAECPSLEERSDYENCQDAPCPGPVECVLGDHIPADICSTECTQIETQEILVEGTVFGTLCPSVEERSRSVDCNSGACTTASNSDEYPRPASTIKVTKSFSTTEDGAVSAAVNELQKMFEMAGEDPSSVIITAATASNSNNDENTVAAQQEIFNQVRTEFFMGASDADTAQTNTEAVYNRLAANEAVGDAGYTLEYSALESDSLPIESPSNTGDTGDTEGSSSSDGGLSTAAIAAVAACGGAVVIAAVVAGVYVKKRNKKSASSESFTASPSSSDGRRSTGVSRHIESMGVPESSSALV
eukprot:Clim_evm18s64 gene=Clim_evmTU18s64